MAQETRAEIRLKIGILASDELRVEGLKAMLSDGGTNDVTALAEPRMLVAARLDLLLLDADATPHPVELIASLHRLKPLLRVLVLGTQAGHNYIEQMIGAGARGYLLHSATEGDLRMAVTVIREGSVWAPRRILSRLLEQARQAPSQTANPTLLPTTRELEVISLLLRGLGNRDMAAALQVKECTVKAHLGRLMRKAAVYNRTALTLRAMELGWCGIPDK